MNLIDKHIGLKISKVRILGRVEDYSTKNQKYNCICDCGNTVLKEYSILLASLKHNHQVSCGCIVMGKWNKGRTRDNYSKSKIGEKHNRLLITNIERKQPNGYLMVCICDCGNTTKQVYADIKNGKVKSCGCYGKEQQSKTGSKVGLNNSSKRCNIYKWHYIKNEKRINIRSGYEVMFAEILDKENLCWEYEPKCFKLYNGKRYTPDFFLPKQNIWVDVKGKFKQSSKEKIEEFRNLGHKIDVVFIKEIEKRFGKSYYLFKKEWKTKHNL